LITYHKLNQQTNCAQCVPSSLFIKTNIFQPLKRHYQGVKTFINENISNGRMSVVNFTFQPF